MDIFDSRYYRINKFFLSTIGRWSYYSGLKQIIPQFLIIFSLVIALPPQILHAYFQLVQLNLDGVLQCFPAIFVILLSVCQLSLYIVNNDEVRKILDCIKYDWDVRAKGMDIEILRDYAETGRFYTLLYAANVGSAVSTVILMSLTNPVLDILFPLNETRIKQPVFEAVLPFDQNKYFYWTFLYGASTGMYNLSIVFTCESLFAITVMHTCGLFSIISNQLKNITELVNSEKSTKNENLSKSVYQQLFYSIENHSYALHFANTLDSFYSPFLFITVFLNVILLSTSGFGLLISLDQMDKCIKYAAYTSGVFVHFYVITLPSQKLLDHSSDVARSAYDVCWYKLPIKSRKLLLLLIQRSQQPCKLTAWKFYNVDMETFSSVIIEYNFFLLNQLVQTSVSFFTVLFSMR